MASVDRYIILLLPTIKPAKENILEGSLLCHLKCGKEVKSNRQNSKICDSNRHVTWLFQNKTEGPIRRISVRINSNCNYIWYKVPHVFMLILLRMGFIIDLFSLTLTGHFVLRGISLSVHARSNHNFIKRCVEKIVTLATTTILF